MEQKECACCKSHGSGETYQTVVRSFEQKRENLIPALHAVQDRIGHLPEEAMVDIATWLEIPVSEVYGTASFYTLFSAEPKGKYIIRLCDSPPCHIEGSKSIKSAVQEALGVAPGETTKDGLFTFEVVSCIGLCGVAPAIMINEEAYGNLTPQSVVDVLNKYRKEA